VRIQVGSYDAPPPGPFDLVIGIESLIHSADPPATIAALAHVLAPGGHLVMVDDMPEPDLPPEPARRFDLFRRYWRCPVAPTRAGWLAAFAAAGLAPVVERDLNPLLRVRSMAEAAPRLAELNAPPERLKRALGLGVRAEAEIGGIMLETLQTEGHVRYRLLVGRKG
jgi:SAM-dependent methyltransferase